MALIYMASGAMFGGVALFGARYGVREGYSGICSGTSGD